MATVKLHRFAVLIVGAVAVLTLPSAMVAAASPAAPTASDPTKSKMYTALHKAVDRLEGAAETQKGFGSIAFTPGLDGVVVYWKGAVPAAVEDLVRKLRSTVPIRIVSAAYSEKELLAERDRLMARSVAGDGPHVYRVGPRPDDSGLDVVVAQGSADRAAAAGVTLTDELASTVRSWVSEGEAPVLASRQSDTSPYFGGDQARNSSNNALCSTGFRVKSGTTYYMVTAWHCTFGGGDIFTTYPSTSKVMGNAQKFNHTHDVELIGSPVGSYGGSIYTGNYNSFTSEPIVGHVTVVVHDDVCMEGGFTGNVCSNEVTAVNQSVNYGGSTGTITGLTLAKNQLVTAEAGQGDSGGPVVQTASSGVKVAGMIEGLDPPFAPSCHGDPNVNRTCSYNVFFTPQAAITAAFGVSIG